MLRPVTCTQKKLNFKFECEFGIPHSNSHLKTPKIQRIYRDHHAEMYNITNTISNILGTF
jgi:hypothetical protein